MPVQAGSVHVRQVFLETKATLIVVSIEIKFYTSDIMTHVSHSKEIIDIISLRTIRIVCI